ncbi:hypothetical protein ACIPWL_19515 [Streptomyces sp. NPDC090023]
MTQPYPPLAGYGFPQQAPGPGGAPLLPLAAQVAYARSLSGM